MLEILPVLLIELLILLCAIGLWRAFDGALRNPKLYNVEISFHRRPSRSKAEVWILIFLIGVLVALFGFRAVTNSYYDFFTTGLLVGSLSMVWFTVIVIGMFAQLFIPDGLVFEGKLGKLTWFMLTIMTAMFVILAGPLLVIPDGIDTIQGVFSGPSMAQGIVQSKTSHFDRSGAYYNMTINNQEFDVPNSAWWNTLRRGDSITYAYNPYSEDGGTAFPPDEIGFTLPGILIIGICLFLLYLTIWISIGGFTKRFAQQPGYYSAEKLPTHFDNWANIPREPAKKAPAKTLSLAGLLVGVALFLFGLIIAWKRYFKRPQH